MNKADLLPIIYERENEKLRQEKESFNQRRFQDSLWFVLRIIMGYSSIILLFSIVVICCIIIFNSKMYPTNVVIIVSSALFIDIVGLIICVWKIVLNPKTFSQITPTTVSINSYDELLNIPDK